MIIAVRSFIKRLFSNRKISAERVVKLIAKHKKQARLETWRDCEKRIRKINEEHRQELIIARKDFLITVAEKDQQIKAFEQRETVLNEKERDIIETQAKLALAARKLNLHLTHMGKTVLKSGEECQGIFESVERLIK